MSFELDRDWFNQWLEGYKQAWERRDPAAAAALFTEDASYSETPFDPPMQGQEAISAYWSNAVSGQRDVRFTYEVLACAGDTGLCRWHAAFTSHPGGDGIDLDGIFRCRFADRGQVSRFEEWWHVKVSPQAAGT